MATPSFKEDHISQFPALLLLQQLGYTYLSPEEALALRGNKAHNVLLEGILRPQLTHINDLKISSTQSIKPDETMLDNAILALKDLPLQEGYMTASQTAYNLLTLGKTLEQTTNGNRKSHTLQYIHWGDISKNVFHVTEEFTVIRQNGKDSYRPDIVLFINGIPICVIECKRPDIKEPINEAIYQHLRNQQADGIRPLYMYSQLLLSLATTLARYGTTDTKAERWAIWKEKYTSQHEKNNDLAQLHTLVNTAPSVLQTQKLYAQRETWEVRLLQSLSQQTRSISPQDEYLYYLCRPQRLMELIQQFIVFEGGIYKKIALYQQYFGIKKIIHRVQHLDKGKRKGGAIWHTQGSGKSLSMAMLANQIKLTIRNPKIIIVTDRTDLDNQITATFQRVKIDVQNAHSGKQLAALLQKTSDDVITTVINKFEAAVTILEKNPLTSPDIFVLIDEGHRTQYGTFNVKMQKALPNACFLAFTGTPLMKKEKSTAQKFGGIIDTYTIAEAVEDGAIIPILYEGRHALQDINQKALDRGFQQVAENLGDIEKTELKKKYSQADLIKKTDQRIYEIATDISNHYKANWGKSDTGHTGFKGMVVTSDKQTAIKYKKAFDLINKVQTEVIISPPDMREGTEDMHQEATDEVILFWKQMETKHGKNFEKTLLTQFQKSQNPELLIVVDKLLTGFDEPKLVVLYLCRKLKEHTLLQAIARVNRVYPDKNYGFIIDYEGVIKELDTAMNLYTQQNSFDAEDLQNTVTHIAEVIKKLPQLHSDLVQIFKTLTNTSDIPSYCTLLADEQLRTLFYDNYREFAKYLKIALASIYYENNETPENKKLYLQDLAFFTKLRAAVMNIYSETIDFRKYEKQLQKLLDQHVITDEIIVVTQLVSIIDTEAFQRELEKITGFRAKAETMASRTQKYLTEKINEDPVYYKKLSQLIQETIDALRENRLSEAEAFENMKKYMAQTLAKKQEDIPAALLANEKTIAFFHAAQERTNLAPEQAANFALVVDEILQNNMIIDWVTKTDISRKIAFQISEYLIDEHNIEAQIADFLAEDCLTSAKITYFC